MDIMGAEGGGEVVAWMKSVYAPTRYPEVLLHGERQKIMNGADGVFASVVIESIYTIPLVRQSEAGTVDASPEAERPMGGEQEAFEAWAMSQNYDMRQHPLHYLFLNERTYAARQGWKAGVAYAHPPAATGSEGETPETDAQETIKISESEGGGEWVSVDFAQRLERRLRAALKGGNG